MGLKGAVFGAIGAGVANVIGTAWGGNTNVDKDYSIVV